jgi:hypothetical protein
MDGEVSENRVLWRVFGPKRVEIMEGWRKVVHNVSLVTCSLLQI